MTAPYLAEMAARAAECGILADCADDPRIARWFRNHAIEIVRWQILARSAERALDEIAENAREEADDAERQARAERNPGRGPSPAANCPSTAAGASDPGRGTPIPGSEESPRRCVSRVAPSACRPGSEYRGASPLRTIEDVFALAEGRRGVVVAWRPRVVLSRDGETAL